MRLRRSEWPYGRCEFKLTQKVPSAEPGAVQGLITNTYLSSAEYDLFASLPAAVLSKTRESLLQWMGEYGIHHHLATVRSLPDPPIRRSRPRPP